MLRNMRTPQTTPKDVRIRRGYFECRYGQLHVHNAIPPGGGFDEGTPVLALHHGPMSGAAFGPLLPLLGRTRSVYAPDLPGFGSSDAPPTPASVPDYAAAIGDFCDSMRFRQIDVVGYQLGSLVGAELAAGRPTGVRRLVCIGLPLDAAPDYPAKERLGRITQPCLIIRPRDEWWQATLRGRELMPKAKLIELPEAGAEALASAPSRIAELLLDFLTP